MKALEVTGLAKHFGGIKAVELVDFHVSEGEFVGLIGPNGCGKSTTFNTISGLLEATAGEVSVFGEKATGMEPHIIHKMGLTRTFQHTRLWKEMTVIENLLIPPRKQKGQFPHDALIAMTMDRDEEKARIAKAWKILETLEITHISHLLAGELSGGQSKLVDIGRALMGEPKLLLLDEPVAGVAGPLADSIFSHLRRLVNETGISILIIEHNMNFILRKGVDRVIVMNEGKILMSGTPDEVRGNEQVVSAYLGGAGVESEDLPDFTVMQREKRREEAIPIQQKIAGWVFLLTSFFAPLNNSTSSYEIITRNSSFTTLIGEHLLLFTIGDFIYIGFLFLLILFAISQLIMIISVSHSLLFTKEIQDEANHIVTASALILFFGLVMMIFSDVAEVSFPWGALSSLLAGIIFIHRVDDSTKVGEEE